MSTRRASTSLFFHVASLFVLASCGSSKSGAMDAGADLAVVVDGAMPDDGGSPDGSMASTDLSGADGSVVTGPLTSCATSQRVDTLRGVDGSAKTSAAGYGDKWVVTWFQLASVSPDSMYHWKARYFDGSALATEVDLGIDAFGLATPTVSDRAGHAFAQRFVSGNSERRVFDFAAGTFAAATTFTQTMTGGGYFDLVGLPSVGALSLFHDSTNVLADKYAAGAWTTTGLAGTPAVSFDQRLAANANGKAIGSWYADDGSGGTNLTVAAYNGTTWATPTVHDFTTAGGSAGYFQYAALSNGDGIIAYVAGPNGDLASIRYHAATGVFDAPITIESVSGQTVAVPAVIADSNDRVTYAWLRGGHAYARRDLGTGLGAVSDLGLSTSVSLTLDPSQSNVLALSFRTSTIYIQRATPADATFAAPIAANVGVSNGTIVDRQSPVVFDSAGRPTIVTMQDAAGAGGLELVYTKCQ